MSSNSPRLSAPGAQRSVIVLDVLRLLAALSVVAYHYFFYASTEETIGGIGEIAGYWLNYPGLVSYTWWGWVGVYVFFVISGFVIAMSASDKSASEFAIGRFTRIYPALIVFSALALIVILTESSVPASMSIASWFRSIILFPRGPWIDGAIWTLTVEALFYAVITVMIFLNVYRRIGGIVRFYTVLSTVFWIAVLYQQYGPGAPDGSILQAVAESYKAKFFLLTTGSFFAVGMIFHEIYVLGNRFERSVFLYLAVLDSVAALHTFSLSSAGVAQFDQNAILPISVWLAAVAVIGFAIPMERLRTPSLFYRKIARQLGLMTYPLYLVHQISGAFIIAILFQMGLGRVFSPSVGIGIVVLISWLFARHIEPGMRRRIDHACRTVIDHFTPRYAFQRTQNED